jgi:hypothetical protein
MRRPLTTGSAVIRWWLAGIALALCGAPAPAHAQDRPAEIQTEPQGLIREPDAVHRAALFGNRHFGAGDMRNGWYVDTQTMIPGAGWIAGGPGYRSWYRKDSLFVDASAAMSWRGYRTAQARVELPKLVRSRLAIGSQARWQDAKQIDVFGEGPDTLETNRAQYRLRSTNLVGYATLRPVQWLGIGTHLGWLKPSVRAPSGSFRSDRPDARDLFPADPVFARADQPAFLHTEASVTADTRDYPGHPNRGGLVRAAAGNYSDRDGGAFSFRRYEAEAAGFMPLSSGRVVLALHGWVVASGTGDGGVVPFYLQPSLGGHNSLRGYADYRFHDRNLLVVNAEARVAMMTHVDAAVFVDAGNVAARAGDLNMNRKSYGAGLRLHSRRATFARLDVARGGEGWRVMFRLTDPLNLARLARRTAPAPFVP